MLTLFLCQILLNMIVNMSLFLLSAARILRFTISPIPVPIFHLSNGAHLAFAFSLIPHIAPRPQECRLQAANKVENERHSWAVIYDRTIFN